MSDWLLAVLAAAWMIEALLLGYAMGRGGHDAYRWTSLAIFLGPLAVAVAIRERLRTPSREPRLLRAGSPGPGPVDVLVGIDGSSEAIAALDRAASLLMATAGRVTLVRVVPIDATPQLERLAEAELASAAAARPDLNPATMVLHGDPVDQLRDHAGRLGYEVLVVGTRGEGRRVPRSGGSDCTRPWHGAPRAAGRQRPRLGVPHGGSASPRPASSTHRLPGRIAPVGGPGARVEWRAAPAS